MQKMPPDCTQERVFDTKTHPKCQKKFRLRRPYYNRIPLSKCSKTQILALGEKAAQARKKVSRHKRKKKRFSAACGGKKERRISLVPCEFMYINHN